MGDPAQRCGIRGHRALDGDGSGVILANTRHPKRRVWSLAMPNTLLALIIAAVAVLPGFVTAELTQRQRAVQPSGDGQSVVLRALFYALVIHLLWSWWTLQLAQHLAGAAWRNSLIELPGWAIVVSIISPIALGLPLNHLLRAAENKGSLSWWHYALGGRDARDAWDLVFQRVAESGAWVLVHLKDDHPGSPRIVMGRYGRHSSVGQSPASHDLFLQEMWALDDARRPVAPLDPPRGMWVAKEGIAELYVFDIDPAR